MAEPIDPVVARDRFEQTFSAARQLFTDTTTPPQENNAMPSVQFFPLPGLSAAVTASRKDLSKLRALNAALTQKVSSLTEKSGRYTPQFIAENAAVYRSEATKSAHEYLQKENTMSRLQSLMDQREQWTTEAYLRRASVVPPVSLAKYDDSGNSVALLKNIAAQMQLNNALLSASRMPVESLAQSFDDAAQRQDWQTLGAVYQELKYRSSNDEASRLTLYKAAELRIPEVENALSLIEEAAFVKQLIQSTVTSITSGAEDVGMRQERYADMDAEQRAARQEQTASAAAAVGH